LNRAGDEEKLRLLKLKVLAFRPRMVIVLLIQYLTNLKVAAGNSRWQRLARALWLMTVPISIYWSARELKLRATFDQF